MSAIDKFRNQQQERYKKELESLWKDKSNSIVDLRKKIRAKAPDEKMANSMLALMAAGKFDIAAQMATYRSAKKDKHVVRVSQETISRVAQHQLGTLAVRTTPEEMRVASVSEGVITYSLDSFIPFVQTKSGEVSRASIQNYLMETFVGSARLFDDSGMLIEGTNIDKDRFKTLLERNFAKDMVIPIDHISSVSQGLSEVIFSQFTAQKDLDQMLARFDATPEDQKGELTNQIANARQRVMSANAFIVDHITSLQTASKTNQITASHVAKTIKTLDEFEKGYNAKSLEEIKENLLNEKEVLEKQGDAITEDDKKRLEAIEKDLQALAKGFPSFEVEQEQTGIIKNLEIDRDSQQYLVHKEAKDSYYGAINNSQKAIIASNLNEYTQPIARRFKLEEAQVGSLKDFFVNDNGSVLTNEQLGLIGYVFKSDLSRLSSEDKNNLLEGLKTIIPDASLDSDNINLTKAKLQLVLDYRKSAEQILEDVKEPELGLLSVIPHEKRARVKELLKNPSEFGLQGKQGQDYLNKQNVLINFIESYQPGCTGNPEDDMLIGMLRCASNMQRENSLSNKIMATRVDSLLDLNDMKLLAGFSKEECFAKFEEIVPERALEIRNFITQNGARSKASASIVNKVNEISAEDLVSSYTENNFKFNGKTLISGEQFYDLKRATIVPNNEGASKKAFEEALRDKLIDEMKVELSHAEFDYDKESGKWAFINSDGSLSQIMEDLEFGSWVEERSASGELTRKFVPSSGADKIGNDAQNLYENLVNEARLKQTYDQYNQLLNDGNLKEAKVLFNKMINEAIADKDNFPKSLRSVILSDPMAQKTLLEKLSDAESGVVEIEKGSDLESILNGESKAVVKDGIPTVRLPRADGTFVGPVIEELKIFLARTGTPEKQKEDALRKGYEVVNLEFGAMIQLPDSISKEKFEEHKHNIIRKVEGYKKFFGENNCKAIIESLNNGQVFVPGGGVNATDPKGEKSVNKNVAKSLQEIVWKEFGLSVDDLNVVEGYFPIGKDVAILKEAKVRSVLREASKPSWQRQKYIGKDTRIQPGKEAENEKKKKEAEKQLQEEFDKPSVGPAGQVNMGKLIYMLGNVDNVIDAAMFSAQHFQKSDALLKQHKTVQLSYPGLGMCEGGIHRDTTNSLYSKYQMTSDVQSFLRAPNGQLRFSESSMNLAIGRIETYINKGALTPDALMHLMTTDKYLNVIGLNKNPDVYKRFMQELEDRGMIPPKTHTGNDINFEGKSEIERFEYSYNLKKNSKKYNFTLTEEQISKLTPAQQKQYAKDKDEFDKNFIQARVFSTDGAKIKPSEVAKLFEKGGPLADVSPAVRIWYNEKLKEAISTDQLGYYDINDNRFVVPDVRTGGEVVVEVKYGPPEKLQLNSIDDLQTYINKASAMNNGCLPADVLDKIPFDLIEIPGMTFEEKAKFEKRVEAAALTRIAQAKDAEATYGLLKAVKLDESGKEVETYVPYSVEDEIRDRSKFVFDGPDTLSKEERDWLIANQEHIDAIRTQKIELVAKKQAVNLGKADASELAVAQSNMASTMADVFAKNYSMDLARLKADARLASIPEEKLEAMARQSAMETMQEVYYNECVEGLVANKSAFAKEVEEACAEELYKIKNPEVESVSRTESSYEVTKVDGSKEIVSFEAFGSVLGKEDKTEISLNIPVLKPGENPENNCLYTFDIQNGVKNATPLEQAVANAEAPLIQSIQKAKTAYYQGSTARVIDGKTTENANGDVSIFCNNIMKDIKQEIKNISQIKDPKQREARMRALEQVLYREGLIGFMQNNPNGKAMVEQLKAELAQETQKEHDGVDLDKAPEIEEVANEQDAVNMVDEIVQANSEQVTKDANELALQLEDLAAVGDIAMMNDRPSVDPNAIEEMGM